jgi:hypothetical protein
MSEVWWVVIAAVGVLAVVSYVFWSARPVSRLSRFAQARRSFHAQREGLEAKFIRLAASRAKPNAPRWADCNFADDVAYVRSRSTGELAALVAVTIATEDRDRAFRGSADAVGNLLAGTAVFRFDGTHWGTDGRAILNLSPSEAIRHYHDDLEMVGEELAHRTTD